MQTDRHDKANGHFFFFFLKILQMCLRKKFCLCIMWPVGSFNWVQECVWDTHNAQHFTSIYSAMLHSNSIQRPNKAHHISTSQCELNFMSLYTEKCNTTITERGPDGGEEGKKFLNSFHSQCKHDSYSYLQYPAISPPPSKSFKCPIKLKNLWAMISWKMFEEAWTSWHLVSPHFPVSNMFKNPIYKCFV